MSLRNVRVRGDEILTKKSKEVKVIDAKTKQLIDDMRETMEHYEGCGIAAVQVGILKDIIVCKPDEKGESFVFINPKITNFSEQKSVDSEGCLSVPDKRGNVKRSDKITLEAQDIDMHPLKMDLEGFFARVVQHEVDHLNGVLYTDKLVGELYDVELDGE